MESASPSAQGGKGRKLGLVEIRLADEPWAPVAQGHPGAEVVRSVRVALRGTNASRHQVRASDATISRAPDRELWCTTLVRPSWALVCGV